MTQLPAVSVVISSFNRSVALRSAIEGLLDQDVPADLVYEVILVDNNSTDDTAAVIAQLLKEDRTGRLRAIHEPRQGVSYGRNAGIAAAAAPIIAFTDDDNFAGRHWVRRIKEVFDREPELDVVGGRVLPVWPAGVPEWIGPPDWSPLALLDFGDHAITTSASYPRCMLTANLAVRREVFDAIGGFSPEFPRCQDHEWLLRLWRSGRKAMYLPELVVYAEVQPQRLTRGYHRRWYRMHGKYAASMHLQEIIDSRGRLVTERPDIPRLLGTPGYVYCDLADHVRQMAVAALRFRRTDLEHHSHRVLYFAAYIRENAARALRSRPQSLGADIWTFLTTSTRRASARIGVSMPRLALVHALMLMLLGGSAYDIVTGREHWPLSPYPMFSTVDREYTLQGFRMVGVTAEAEPRLVPIRDYAMLEPLDQCRVATAFARTVNNRQRVHLAQEMLRDRLRHYERLRRAGNHEGPPLASLRLYDMFWMLDRNGANVDTPTRADLVVEVSHVDAEP
jgi:glycosyltransferase involved in cell wall biosynthesis